jgi:hypothetical protein
MAGSPFPIDRIYQKGVIIRKNPAEKYRARFVLQLYMTKSEEIRQSPWPFKFVLFPDLQLWY